MGTPAYNMQRTTLSLIVAAALLASVIATAPPQRPNPAEPCLTNGRPCDHSDAATSRSGTDHATGWFGQRKPVCMGAPGCEKHVKQINCEAGAACKWLGLDSSNCENCTSFNRIRKQLPEDDAGLLQTGVAAAIKRTRLRQKLADGSLVAEPGVAAASKWALLQDKLADSSAGSSCAPDTPVHKYQPGEWVDVMILQPGQTTSDRWRRCVVTAVDCQGRYSLTFDDGRAVRPALSTGIEAHHLRPTQIGR